MFTIGSTEVHLWSVCPERINGPNSLIYLDSLMTLEEKCDRLARNDPSDLKFADPPN